MTGPSKPSREVAFQVPAGLALLRGHSVDEGSGQGSVRGADRLGAAPSPSPSPSRAVTSLPPAAQPGTSPQVTSGVRSYGSSPTGAMKRRHKSRMLVNDSSGWPSPAHNRHSQVCLAPDNGGAGGVWGGGGSAVLTAGHPAMSPHKPAPSPRSQLFPGAGFVLCCVVLPVGAFAALQRKQVRHPQMVYLVLPLGFPWLPRHFPAALEAQPRLGGAA